MKKIFLLIVIAAGLAGCSKNNNNPKPTTAALITGQWYYTVDTVTTTTTTTTASGNNTSQSTSSNGYARSNYVQFNADGTGLQYDQNSGSKTAFTYQITGKVILLNYPSQVILGTTTDAKSQNATIKTLSASSLELFFSKSSVSGAVTVQTTEAAYFSK